MPSNELIRLNEARLYVWSFADGQVDRIRYVHNLGELALALCVDQKDKIVFDQHGFFVLDTFGSFVNKCDNPVFMEELRPTLIYAQEGRLLRLYVVHSKGVPEVCDIVAARSHEQARWLAWKAQEAGRFGKGYCDLGARLVKEGTMVDADEYGNYVKVIGHGIVTFPGEPHVLDWDREFFMQLSLLGRMERGDIYTDYNKEVQAK